MKLKLSTSLLALGLLLALTTSGSAALISGTLNIVGDVRVTNDYDGTGDRAIDFIPPVGAPDGDFGVTSGIVNTGSFAPLALTSGDIKDIPEVPPDPLNNPIDDFLIFAADPSLRFHLTSLLPGNLGGGSPITLIETGGSTTASFRVFGTFTDGSGDPVSNASGTFTSQFDGQTIAEVLAVFASQGFIENSYSATFTATPIPEPGTVTLLIAGGVLLVLGRKFHGNLKS